MGCWSKEIKAALLSRERDICLFCGTARNTGDLISDEGGAPTKSDEDISDDGEASRDKRDSSG